MDTEEYKRFLHAWSQFNSRRRQNGEDELTLQEYEDYRENTSKTRGGRPHPKIDESKMKAVFMFGLDIFTKKQECSVCGKKKPKSEFLKRFSVGKIAGVCLDCNNDRMYNSKG